MWLYFQLGKQFCIDLHRYLGSALLFPIMPLYFFHSREENVFPMSMSQLELTQKFQNLGSRGKKEKKKIKKRKKREKKKKGKKRKKKRNRLKMNLLVVSQ